MWKFKIIWPYSTCTITILNVEFTLQYIFEQIWNILEEHADSKTLKKIIFLGVCKIHFIIEFFASNTLMDIHFWRQISWVKWMPRQRIPQLQTSKPQKSTHLLKWKSTDWNILLDLAISTLNINVRCHWCLLYFLVFQRYQQSNWRIETHAFKSSFC